MPIKLLDRYLLREILKPFLFGIIGFTAMLSGTVILFNLVGDISRNGIPWSTGALLFVLRLPAVMTLSFPMATIMGVLLTLGRFAGDSEITALRAGGIGIDRISVPILVFGLLVSFSTIVFNEWVVPKATFTEREIYLGLTHQKTAAIRKNVNLTEYDGDGRPKRIINAQAVQGALMTKVTVVDYEAGALSQITQAQSASYDPRSGWTFNNGIMHRLNPKDSHRMLVLEFEQEKLNFQLSPNDLTGREKSPEEMNALELHNAITYKKRLGENVNQMQIMLQQKFSVPFACLIFALLGCPVAMRHARASNALSVGLSMIIIIAYYILTSISMGLGLAGSLPAFIAAWIPNLVIGSVGGLLLWKATQ